MRRAESKSFSRHKAHIVFLLTTGFAARMMLRSGIARQLVVRGLRVTIISPNAHEDYFQKECKKEGVALVQDPGVSERAAQRFRLLRPYLLDDVMNNLALKTKHDRLREKRPLLGFLLESIGRVIPKGPLFRKMVTFLEVMINRSENVEKLLSSLRPSLLVLPNTFGSTEAVYLIHAKELKVPVVCQMLSWDNITTKGTPLLMPDYFISWGPIMTKEMTDIYGFPVKNIYECGVPHFDVYSDKKKFTTRDCLLKELGLPVSDPYIFYGMVAELYCPNELQILEWLADHVQRDAFAKSCSLIIRPHPLTVSGMYASSTETLGRLNALKSSRVAIDFPPVLSDQLAWDLPTKDMYRLASLLDGCTMCLNAGSTLCLDACMVDRPVINITFDGWEELPYERSARRALDCIHMEKLFSLGGVRIAGSFADLQTHINHYLFHPHSEHEARIRSAKQECGQRDGRATERVVNALLQMVQ